MESILFGMRCFGGERWPANVQNPNAEMLGLARVDGVTPVSDV